MSIPFALQLYTVRDHCEKDAAATLKRVKEIGYDYVEMAGTWGLSAGDAKRLLDDAGLTPIAAHVDLQDLSAGADQAKTLGVKYVVGGVWFEGGASREEWIDTGANLNAAGAGLRDQGLRLCYHNHDHEFVTLDGECAYDLMMNAALPENLAAEIDTYWVTEAGLDPVAVIKQYAARCPLLHIKDMTAGADHTFAEVGRGVIDWPPVFAAGKAADVEWYIVEQDVCAGDPLESARISAEFMARQ